MSLKLNSSGSGSVTLQEPVTASNRTLNLPDVDATVLTDSAGVLNIGSGQVYKDASGNVGIGVTSPSTRLDVQDSANELVVARVHATAGTQANRIARLDLISGGNWSWRIDGANNSMRFLQDATERARITNSGDFYLGNTAGIVGNEKLSISQPTSAFWAQAIQLGNTANGTLYTNTSGTASYTAVSFRNNGTTLTIVGNITVSGTTVTYGSVSDYRLKENVQPMTNALAKVAELKPCTYTWKSDGSNGEGFIAHELQSVIPSSVAGEKDSVNEDGSINPQMVDTSFIVATLTAAIQELNAKVEAQAAEIAALKGAA